MMNLPRVVIVSLFNDLANYNVAMSMGHYSPIKSNSEINHLINNLKKNKQKADVVITDNENIDTESLRKLLAINGVHARVSVISAQVEDHIEAERVGQLFGRVESDNHFWGNKQDLLNSDSVVYTDMLPDYSGVNEFLMTKAVNPNEFKLTPNGRLEARVHKLNAHEAEKFLRKAILLAFEEMGVSPKAEALNNLEEQITVRSELKTFSRGYTNAYSEDHFYASVDLEEVMKATFKN